MPALLRADSRQTTKREQPAFQAEHGRRRSTTLQARDDTYFR